VGYWGGAIAATVLTPVLGEAQCRDPESQSRSCWEQSWGRAWIGLHSVPL
jgi:hypothetical protein